MTDTPTPPTAPSETPRADAAIAKCHGSSVEWLALMERNGFAGYCDADFARALERELAALTARSKEDQEAGDRAIRVRMVERDDALQRLAEATRNNTSICEVSLRNAQERDDLAVELAKAKAKIKTLCADWADDHTRLQQMCREAGVPKERVDGSPEGVPGILELAEMLHDELAAAKAELAPLRELVGVDARAVSALSDIDHWKKLMDAWDDNVRLRAENELAERDAGLYAATLHLSAVQLGCDDHMVDHAVKDLRAENQRLRRLVADRDGGEPEAMLEELDEANRTIEALRAENERLLKLLGRAENKVTALAHSSLEKVREWLGNDENWPPG